MYTRMREKGLCNEVMVGRVEGSSKYVREKC